MHPFIPSVLNCWVFGPPGLTEEERLNRLFRHSHYWEVVRGAASRLHRCPHFIDDVSQGASLRIIPAFAGFNPAQGRLEAWVGRIAYHVAVDLLNANNKVGLLQDPTAMTVVVALDAADAVSRDAEIAVVNEAVRRLTDHNLLLMALVEMEVLDREVAANLAAPHPVCAGHFVRHYRPLLHDYLRGALEK